MVANDSPKPLPQLRHRPLADHAWAVTCLCIQPAEHALIPLPRLCRLQPGLASACLCMCLLDTPLLQSPAWAALVKLQRPGFGQLVYVAC